MNKQELIKRIEVLPYTEGPIADTITINRNWILESIKQLDEPQKVKVPQFVADWIEVCKENLAIGLYTAMNPDFLKQYNKSDKLISWVRKSNNQNLFARAWLDGYEVEEEKQYEVILSNGQSLKTVYRQGSDHLDFKMVYGDLESFTRKQLEEAGFGWVFDCPGIEIEEVEDE